MDRDARCEGQVAHLFAAGVGDEQGAVGRLRRLEAVGAQLRRQLVLAGRAHAHGAADAGGELGERRLDHQPPPVDDHHLVDRLRDLGEDVARDEDGASLSGEGAQEVPQPADALGIESVRRFVEDQQLGLAEERGGETQPLPHAERVALDAPLRRSRQLDDTHTSRRGSRAAGGAGQISR